MSKRRRTSAPVVGGSSLLVFFAVLCLTVFALLSLSTVQADQSLSEQSAQAVGEYYAADLQAEALFARIRAGECPDQVTEENGVYTYACTISDTQELRVMLKQEEAGWTVVQWQAVSTVHWQEDDLLPVWDGTVS